MTEQVPEDACKSADAPPANLPEAPALDAVGEADTFAGEEVDVDEYGEETG
jgi:hypothetical protein